MSNIIKHVGLNNAKKVIILWPRCPGEEHMALALYEDKIPATYKDAIHKVVESVAGQQAKNLADALFEVKLPDSRNLLETLHKEGHIKKIQTDQTFMTPDSINKIKLNELNDMLDKIEVGGDAAQKLSDLDAQKGMNRKNRKSVVVEEGLTLSANDKSTISALKKQTEQLTGTVEALLIEVRKLKGEKVPEVVVAKAKKVK
jgi:hypothetical protein